MNGAGKGILPVLPQTFRRIGREALLPWLVLAVLGASYELGAQDLVALAVPVFVCMVLLFPSVPLRMLERWREAPETEWMLAKGTWSRRQLTRTLLLEVLVSALGRAVVFAVLSILGAQWNIGVATSLFSSPEPTFLSALGLAFLVALAAQSACFLLANAAYSNRVPSWWRRGDLLRAPVGMWAANARAFAAIGLVLACFAGSFWLTRSPWGVAVPAVLFTALLAWLLPELEPVAGEGRAVGGGRAQPKELPHRNFAPLLGLIWQGSRPIYRLLHLAAFLPLLVLLGCTAIDDAPLGIRARSALGLWIIMLLLVALWRTPFRWQSLGERAEYLWSSGVDLADLRRIELMHGLLLGVGFVAAGLALLPEGRFHPGFWIAFALPTCSALLLCNRARLPVSRWGPERARDCFRAFFWSAIAAGSLGYLAHHFLPAPAGELALPFLYLQLGLLVAFCVVSVSLWLWALSRAGDDGALRRELEASSTALARRG